MKIINMNTILILTIILSTILCLRLHTNPNKIIHEYPETP
jgi:hypothetical protein